MLIRDKRTGKSLVMFHTKKTADVNIKKWFRHREETVGDFEVDYRLFDNGEVEFTREDVKKYNVSKVFAVKRHPYSRAIACWRYMNMEFRLDWTFDEFLGHLEQALEEWPHNSPCPLNWKGRMCDQYDCRSFCHFHKHCLTTQMSVIGNIYPVQLLSFESLQEDFTNFMESIGFEGDTTFISEMVEQPLDWFTSDKEMTPNRLRRALAGVAQINTEKNLDVLNKIKALQPDLVYDTILPSEQKNRIYQIYSDDFQKLGYLR